jgi:1-acyl-sn-glycerol-3-phosphate acyltransferase
LSYIRASLFLFGYTVFTVFYGALSLPLRLAPAVTRHRGIISWTHLVVWWVKLVCGVRYEIIGKEKLEGISDPVVVLSKHQCAWETFFLQGLFWPASTVLKKELLALPFFGWGLSSLRPIAIDRENPREALKQVKTQGVERLKSGTNLILFPEGTRVKIGEKAKYARSGAEIAAKAEALVVPVSHNAGKYWGQEKTFIKTPGVIKVVIGDPIDSTSLSSREVTAKVEDWIESTLEKIEANEI